MYYCKEHQPELEMRCSKCGPKPLAEFTEDAQKYAARNHKYGDKSSRNLCLRCIAERDVKECRKCKKRKQKELFGRDKDRSIKSICLECENPVKCEEDVETEKKKKKKTEVYPTCAVCQKQSKVPVKDVSEEQPWYCGVSFKNYVLIDYIL